MTMEQNFREDIERGNFDSSRLIFEERYLAIYTNLMMLNPGDRWSME